GRNAPIGPGAGDRSVLARLAPLVSAPVNRGPRHVLRRVAEPVFREAPLEVHPGAARDLRLDVDEVDLEDLVDVVAVDDVDRGPPGARGKVLEDDLAHDLHL